VTERLDQRFPEQRCSPAVLYRLSFPRAQLHFVRFAEKTLSPLTDAELLTILVGEHVGAPGGELLVGEVTCTWFDSEDDPRSKLLGFKSMRWGRIPLRNGRATQLAVIRGRAALVQARPILDDFGPHEPWEPAPAERAVIESAVDDRFRDVYWLTMVLGTGFAVERDPSTVRAHLAYAELEGARRQRRRVRVRF